VIQNAEQRHPPESKVEARGCPKMYRVMTPDGQRPKAARSARCLGVRVPPDKYRDVEPDAEGRVGPLGKGMSVAPTIADLPFNRMSPRLRPDGRGKDEDRVFRLGTVAFNRMPVGNDLELAPNAPDHGVVQPIRVMQLELYEMALAATRDDWIVEEA
jgi:hypothetical protein